MVSVCGMAQDVLNFRATKFNCRFVNHDTGKWKPWNGVRYCELIITFSFSTNARTVSIHGGQYPQTYSIYDKREGTYNNGCKFIKFYAFDKYKDRCVIDVCFYTDDSIDITVTTPDYDEFVYYCYFLN